MFKPFSVFVGLRYSLARKRNLLLSFVSLISMLGISLGVMILIVALSVMNGSIATLRAEALKAVPHVLLSGPGLADYWASNPEAFAPGEGIVAAAPFIQGEASVRHQGNAAFVQLRGIDPMLEPQVLDNPGDIQGELYRELADQEGAIILSTGLAAELGIFSSARLSVLSLGSLLARSLGEAQGLDVIGFINFGIYGNDNVAVVNLAQAETLFADDAGVEMQVRLKVDDIFAAREIAEARFGEVPGITVSPWNEIQASLFNALNLEKFMTSFMLLMIVLIGAVNIVSTLVMVVSDKGADIAILRTMGASRPTIVRVFIIQGMIAGVAGTILGAILGVLLAYNITGISLAVEGLINSLLSEGNIYLISHLRTSVDWGEVTLVCMAALLISFLATLYPAWRASRVQPAEVLRYE